MEPFSAAYFNKLKEVLVHSGRNPLVTMQVFQRGSGILCGVREVKEIFRGREVLIRTLPDGSKVKPNEPVMHISGLFQNFCDLESVYLGTLARCSAVATNASRVVAAAKGKKVIGMFDRFDAPANQRLDGYAASVGGITNLVTQAQIFGAGLSGDPKGTMPHALIAAFEGNTVEACKAYRDTFPGEPVTALVDFGNSCVTTSVEVAKALGPDLAAVRLDTSGSLVDFSLSRRKDQKQFLKGVSIPLVWNVRNALDNIGRHDVEIIVSGGFTPEKISMFEAYGTPVDAYGVGSSIINTRNNPEKTTTDFTADVVVVNGELVSKVGRSYNVSNRMEQVVYE